MRLAFLTKLLGMPAHSFLGAPSLFLTRSVVNTIGPRFSFIKDCLPNHTAQWLPTTLLRSSDEVGKLPRNLLYQQSSTFLLHAHKKDVFKVFSGPGNFINFNAMGKRPCVTLRNLCTQDFCELTDAPLEQYAIYKKQWQEANGKRFQAK